MATSIYLDIDQGSDFRAEIIITDDNGGVMNLAGYQISSQFRKHYSSKTGYSFISSISDPTNGAILLSLPASVSSDIKPGRYVYDIELSINGSRFRAVEGLLTINPEITRDT